MAPAALIVLALLLPFLDKAFTIDDVTFLREAEHVLEDPLHPTAFDHVFEGTRMRLSNAIVTGPVMAYLLVPSILIGGAEWAAHVVQLGLLLAGLYFTASLVLRLGLGLGRAALACLLVAVSPAVTAMASTAMPDVPAMTFAVAGMERTLAWKQSRKAWAGIAAALLLGLAALSRPHLVLLIPVAWIWLIDEEEWRRGPGERARALISQSAMPIAVAVGALLVVTLVMADPESGDNLAGATLGRLKSNTLWANLANFTLQWSVSFPLTLVWASMTWRGLGPGLALAGGVALGLLLSWLGGLLHLAVFIVLTVLVLVNILRRTWSSRDQTQVVLVLWLLMAAATAPYDHLPAKFLVPSAPAMACLVAGLPKDLLRRYRPTIATVSGAGIVLGALIIEADRNLAEIGRIGGDIAARYVNAGEKVWIDGGWGSQWYAMRAGAEPLADTPPLPEVGDVVVTGWVAWLLKRDYPDKDLLYRRVFSAPGGRLFGNGAGFYSSGLPWVWGVGELGRIEVWRLRHGRQTHSGG